MPAAAAAPMQGTYIPQYTAVPASAITVEVRGQKCMLSSCPIAPSLICVCLWFRAVLLAWDKTLKIQFDTIMRSMFYVRRTVVLPTYQF